MSAACINENEAAVQPRTQKGSGVVLGLTAAPMDHGGIGPAERAMRASPSIWPEPERAIVRDHHNYGLSDLVELLHRKGLPRHRHADRYLISE